MKLLILVPKLSTKLSQHYTGIRHSTIMCLINKNKPRITKLLDLFIRMVFISSKSDGGSLQIKKLDCEMGHIVCKECFEVCITLYCS